MSTPRLVPAAGCIIWHPRPDEPEVVLVHRPKYDDWSFPKGKLDPGERSYAAAIREVEEETGLRVRLGPRLADQEYDISGGERKLVHYWAARADKRADVADYEPNAEIDEVSWCSVAKARKLLSYPRDVQQLDDFLATDVDTSPLLIVRHAQARKRSGWHGDDGERPLKSEGRSAARRLVQLLSAYGVTTVVSSDAARCVDTVLPYLNASWAKVTLDPALSQDGVDVPRLHQRIGKLLAGHKAAAVCSHRPVLPEIFTSLGLKPTSLEPGGVLVAHRRDGEVMSTELYDG